jgi:hypothetical protein
MRQDRIKPSAPAGRALQSSAAEQPAERRGPCPDGPMPDRPVSDIASRVGAPSAMNIASARSKTAHVSLAEVGHSYFGMRFVGFFG